RPRSPVVVARDRGRVFSRARRQIEATFADGISMPMQPSSGFQNSWLGKPGHVSMADIVKMGRPQGKPIGMPSGANVSPNQKGEDTTDRLDIHWTIWAKVEVDDLGFWANDTTTISMRGRLIALIVLNQPAHNRPRVKKVARPIITPLEASIF
ncbi:hypothetical protein GW17_00043556, partial [Ensete ventricosum]